MKKREHFEMRIYESIGVLYFRKMVFTLERIVHRKDKGQNENYHIPYTAVEGLDAFIKYLFYNGAIHFRNTIAILLYYLVKALWIKEFHWFDLFIGLFLLKDIFCVILQRYNYLRIKKRKEILTQKRNQLIEKEASKIKSIKNYSADEKAQDLLLIRRLRESISDKKSIILNAEDIDKLNRLSELLSSRNQKCQNIERRFIHGQFK